MYFYHGLSWCLRSTRSVPLKADVWELEDISGFTDTIDVRVLDPDSVVAQGLRISVQNQSDEIDEII